MSQRTTYFTYFWQQLSQKISMEFFNLYFLTSFILLNKFLTFRHWNLTTVMYIYEKFPNRYLQLVKQSSFRRPVKWHSVQAMFMVRAPLSNYKTRQWFECAQCVVVAFSINSEKREIPQNSECKVRTFYYYFSFILFVYLFVYLFFSCF